ncbi:MAG: DUF6056 family protein [Bacilli bacterium]|nr:DUF6056 family protein [Bacilli bacterium]
MKKILGNKVNIILVIFIIEVMFLMYFFPVLHDDLLHGSIPLGFNFMPHVNGRYLGNFFGLALAASLFFRVIIKSAIIFLIIFLSKKLLKINKNIYLLIFISLFLFMPKEMFRETIPFTAGFANYVIPIVGILFMMYIHLNNKMYKNNFLTIILFLSIGIFNSLFVEHITIFNLILAIYLLIFSYIKTKKINFIYLSYFVGAIAGLIIMFTNHTYLVTVNGEDTYRAFSTLQEILKKPFAILRAAFFHNYAINFSLIYLIIILFKNKIMKKNYISSFAIFFIILFGLYSFIKLIDSDMLLLGNYTKHFEALITFIFFILIGYLIYLSKLLNKSELYRLLFYIISIIMILAPLVFVSPLGPRCYIITYILMVILIIDLFIIMEKNKIINIKCIFNILTIIILIQLIFYLSIYGSIYSKNNERLKFVNYQLKQKLEVIEIIDLPYPEYLHMPNICSEYGEIVFRNYYNIPENIVLNGYCK